MIKALDQMRPFHILLDKMRLDQMGLDQMGLDQMGLDKVGRPHHGMSVDRSLYITMLIIEPAWCEQVLYSN